MSTKRNILIAFLLNLGFSVFELLGGVFTGSVAIFADAFHDFADAVSIGISYFCEKKSEREPDERYTYGYGRYSVLGGLITTTVLVVGSVFVILSGIDRIIHPKPINYQGMLIFAIIGVIVNSLAAFFTREKNSLNQRAVNLHMLEDALGYAVVLVGAVIMYFTDIKIIDPLMSIGVALFILINALKNFKEIGSLFLAKTPENISVKEIKEHISELEGVKEVHHVHLWSWDGSNTYATLHAVVDGDAKEIKRLMRQELSEHGISHVTIEIEQVGEACGEHECRRPISDKNSGHHHHHHHHH